MNRLIQSFRRFADLNPVTLKELRQLVRSRVILWAMFAYPVLLLIVCGGILSSASHDVAVGLSPVARAYEFMMIAAGRTLTGGTLVPLGLVTVFVIPLLTGIRLARESARARMDLQFITALTAGDVVGGKLMGAFLLTLTFTALSLPFLALAYLWRGIELAEIAWATLGVVALSLVSTIAALVLGSMRIAVGLRLTVLALVHVFAGVYVFTGTMVVLLMPSSPVSWQVAFLEKAGVFAGTLVLIVFGCAWAASNLMPVHTDFKRTLRQVELGLVLLIWGVALAGAAWTGGKDWPMALCLLSLGLAVLAGFCALHPPGVSRVVAARAPKGFVRRMLSFPMATTAASGALFAFGLSVLSLGLSALLLAWLDRSSLGDLMNALLCMGEFLLVVMPVALVLRLLGRGRPQLVAAGPLIVFALVGVLQFAGLLEMMDVILDAAIVPGNFFATVGDTHRTAHRLYALCGFLLFLCYLVVEVDKTFRRYCAPECCAK
ncbi:MAG: hypothetical protein ACI4R9_09260 [Kiritimatiellia bacterium]